MKIHLVLFCLLNWCSGTALIVTTGTGQCPDGIFCRVGYICLQQNGSNMCVPELNTESAMFAREDAVIAKGSRVTTVTSGTNICPISRKRCDLFYVCFETGDSHICVKKSQVVPDEWTQRINQIPNFKGNSAEPQRRHTVCTLVGIVFLLISQFLGAM
ncbi:unnamed protein product [Bursaphelenchus xylophilus]|uniref:(pine wood nematode) hypothetical protein n=1 Tax=Bursaphelenchus xylophilus TaxID=6326 RepID=A0A1I7RJY2_BURXY|nr:unnamed protein product [Bursaphelenchus xylophilus]CAG9131641.1 unnamed protein product [Bursaphelenchus xylophilus]